MTEKTILLVDDSASLRQVLGDLLEVAGYQVISAAHGLEALTKAKDKSIDLVLCDVNMPVMGGIEFVNEFTKQQGCNDVPVIMLTTEADRELKNAAKEAGAKGWIIKPYNNQQLLNAVAKLTD